MKNVYKIIDNEYIIYYGKKRLIKNLKVNYTITHDKKFIIF